MNKQIMTLAAGLIIAASSCSPSSSPTPATPTLNSTESSLLGTWILDNCQIDYAPTSTSNDTTIYTSNSSFYLQLTKDEFTAGAPNNYKKGQESFLVIGITTVASNSTLVYWYYDEAVAKFVLSNLQYDVVTHTATELKLNYTTVAATTTYTFKK